MESRILPSERGPPVVLQMHCLAVRRQLVGLVGPRQGRVVLLRGRRAAAAAAAAAVVLLAVLVVARRRVPPLPSPPPSPAPPGVAVDPAAEVQPVLLQVALDVQQGEAVDAHPAQERGRRRCGGPAERVEGPEEEGVELGGPAEAWLVACFSFGGEGQGERERASESESGEKEGEKEREEKEEVGGGSW